MRFSVHKKIFDRFPGLNLGVFVVLGIDNRKQSGDLLKMIREREKEIRQNYEYESLSEHPNIRAWRMAYGAFGAKPKKYKSSVESLYRMALSGLELKSINTLVDIYNYISLKHMIPLGGDDLDKLDGDITLSMAQGGEPFTPLNSKQTEFAKTGEVIYADEKEVLCRRWNWRECDKTKMSSKTENVILVLEGLPPVGKADIQLALEDLSDLVRQFCGGEAQEFFLDINHPEREFSFFPRSLP